MNKKIKPHVLVVGMGMAGLMAAYTAAKQGKNVHLLATGLGALSIASGCIDILGYVQKEATKAGEQIETSLETGQAAHGVPVGQTTMQAVQNPWDGLAQLPASHPYSIIGTSAVQQALQMLQELCAEQGAEFTCQEQQNALVPTIIGTLKPTYVYPSASNSAPLFAAKRVLVASVDAIRDCHPHLIAQQLQKYPALQHVAFSTASLPSHFGAAHRAVSPLDVARYVDSKEGFSWLVQALTPLAKDVDAILVPPILGTRIAQEKSSPWKQLQDALDCGVVEMLSLPPGVGGHRLSQLLLKAVRSLGVRIIENATITRAHMHEGRCLALVAHGEGVEHRYEAENFILATGGILGGGITTKPNHAHETILGIPLKTPAIPEDWAAENAFGSHAFTQMGVMVNEKLQALDADGNSVAENVYFAGRTLGAYDYAAEKSGNGVAMATGWYAAQNI